jgi:hypothetical protein
MSSIRIVDSLGENDRTAGRRAYDDVREGDETRQTD